MHMGAAVFIEIAEISAPDNSDARSKALSEMGKINNLRLPPLDTK
jgi:hypothetical protein